MSIGKEIFEIRRLLAAIVRHNHDRAIGNFFRDTLQQRQVHAAGPVQIFENEQRWPLIPHQEGHDETPQAFFRGLGLQFWSIRNRMVDERGDVWNDGLQNRFLERREIAAQGEIPRDVPPQLVRHGASIDRLSAHHERSADQRVNAELVGQSRLANAAFAAEQQKPRLPVTARVTPRIEELTQLRLAADKSCRLQQAFARLDRLRNIGSPDDVSKGSQRVGGSKTMVGRLRHQALHDRDQPGIDACGADRVEVGGIGQHLSDQSVAIGVSERMSAGKHLVHHRAEAVQVRRFVRSAAVEHLRRHVRDAAVDQTGVVEAATVFRNPEVQHFNGAVLRDEDISRLQIAVKDPLPVQIHQCVKHRHDQVDAGRRG